MPIGSGDSHLPVMGSYHLITPLCRFSACVVIDPFSGFVQVVKVSEAVYAVKDGMSGSIAVAARIDLLLSERTISVSTVNMRQN